MGIPFEQFANIRIVTRLPVRGDQFIVGSRICFLKSEQFFCFALVKLAIKNIPEHLN